MKVLEKKITTNNIKNKMEKNTILKNKTNNPQTTDEIDNNNNEFKYLKELCSRTNLELVRKNPLGNGGYSKVYLLQSSNHKNFFACKLLILPPIKDKKDYYNYRYRAAIAYRDSVFSLNARYPSMIKCYAKYKLQDNIYALVMQKANATLQDLIKYFYDKKKLFSFINYNLRKQMSDNFILFYLYQMLKCFKSLKEMCWVHFDIKPDNFLLFGNEIKLSDFSLCDFIPNIGKTKLLPAGTPSFMPIESINAETVENKELYKVDFFSLGCILYKMKFNENVYKNNKNEDSNKVNKEKLILKEIEEKIDKLNNDSSFLNKKRKKEDNLNYIIKRLLEPNIKNRMSFNELFENSFLNNNKKKITMIENNNSEVDVNKLLIELQKPEISRKKKHKIKFF